MKKHATTLILSVLFLASAHGTATAQTEEPPAEERGTPLMELAKLEKGVDQAKADFNKTKDTWVITLANYVTLSAIASATTDEVKKQKMDRTLSEAYTMIVDAGKQIVVAEEMYNGAKTAYARAKSIYDNAQGAVAGNRDFWNQINDGKAFLSGGRTVATFNVGNNMIAKDVVGFTKSITEAKTFMATARKKMDEID